MRRLARLVKENGIWLAWSRRDNPLFPKVDMGAGWMDQALKHWRMTSPSFTMAGLRSLAEEGTGLGDRKGGAACGCLLSISCRNSGEGVATPSKFRALIALPYRPSCAANFTILMLCEEKAYADCSLQLASDWPSARASSHKADKSPSNHPWRRDFTQFRISRHHS